MPAYNTAVAGQRSSIVLLIRHAETSAMRDVLCGRRGAIPLTPEGRRHAEELASALASVHLSAVYSSPLRRARETAEPIAAVHGLRVEVDNGLNEVDFGEWTGCSFADLARRSDWQAYNAARGSAVVPSGEQPKETQARSVTTIARIAVQHAGQIAAAITHAEVVRYVLLHAQGEPLSAWTSIDVGPASVAVVERLHEHSSVDYALHASVLSLSDIGRRRGGRLPQTGSD